MSENKKKAAELAAKNLAQLQKIDIAASKILDKMPFAAIYKYDTAKSNWVKSVIEGTLFIYQRADRPYFSFLIANRNDPSDFIEPLTTNHVIRQEGNYILFHKEVATIQALWFHQINDSNRASALLQKLVDKLKKSTTEQARGAAAAMASAPVPTVEPAPSSSANSKAIDLLNMIKTAQQQTSSQPPTILANLVGHSQEKSNNQETPEVNSMPVLLQKLMVQEQSRSILKEPGTAMSADELEKDLLKTAKPRHHLLQDFANSPSAISLAAISTKSVHGSEGEGDVDVTEGEILEPLETSFIVGSGGTTPTLNKEQFVSAIAHLMRTDDEFVSQIHQAYIDALNRRLNL
uniref:mRNA_decap_C domain-containing protein n=1 Tax=Caenorhabditis japonica TaxID=281687 RepID=A0A8R1DXH2_CAEJA